MRTKIPTTKLGLHYPNFDEKNQIVDNLYYVHVVIIEVWTECNKVVTQTWSYLVKPDSVKKYLTY